MKTSIYIIPISLLIFFVLSCTPKLVQVKEQIKIVEEPVLTEPESINPNCATFESISSSDREIAETAYVLYKDELKLNHFMEAKPLWEKAFFLAPAANGRVKYQFDDGIKIYHYLYQNTENDTLRSKYIDTIMSIYDLRLECIKDTSYVMGRRAYDYFYTFSGTLSDDELFQLLASTIDKSGKQIDYFIINPFTQLLIERYKADKIDKKTAKRYAYMILEGVIYGKSNCKRDCKAWEIVADYAPIRLEAFEGLKDFYECDYYVDRYYDEFEANPTDCDIIEQTFRKLKRGNCDENDVKFEAVAQAKKEHCKVVVADPGPCRSGYTAYTNGNFKEAITHFEACIENQTDMDKKAKYTMLIAKIYYRDLKLFSKARKYALKAANLKSNWGEPYMLIGTLYASSGPLCGPGRGFESQKVVWPAIDKWKYAKKIDPSVSVDANRLINKYKKYMPSREDIHQRAIKKGEKYTVTCWIQETTIVRTAD